MDRQVLSRTAEEPKIQVTEYTLTKPVCKEALKHLNDKEKELKEMMMKAIIKSKAKDSEIVRVLAFLINSFKRL